MKRLCGNVFIETEGRYILLTFLKNRKGKQSEKDENFTFFRRGKFGADCCFQSQLRATERSVELHIDYKDHVTSCVSQLGKTKETAS